MGNQQNNQEQPPITMKWLPDKSLLFSVRDGVTIHATFISNTQLTVQMSRGATNTTVPPDTGNIASKPFRRRLAEGARDYFNLPVGEGGEKSDDTVPHIEEDLGAVATLLGVPEIIAILKEEAGPSIAEQLVEFVEEAGTLFRTPEGKPHVSVRIEDHTETYEVGGEQFKTWLRGHFLARERKRLRDQAIASQEQMIEQLGALVTDDLVNEVKVRKPPIVRPQAIDDAISQLKSIALLEKRTEKVHLRIGGVKGEREQIYIDLGTEEWDAVEVDAAGWRIVKNPPIRFVRANGMLPLPHPSKGGSVDDLREILTLSDSDEDENAWRLILAWLVQALRPGRGHYPVLVLLGGHGTAKSTTGRLIRRVIDPNVVRDIRKPRSEEEIHIDADCSWVIALDNISGMQQWLSDVICRIATGSAMTKRKLYSDRDREIFEATQPQILNGIADVATAGDLLRRSLLINLPVIKKYREEEEIYRELDEAHPGILGALLDAVSAGLKGIENGEAVKAQLPDMADFGKWAIRTEGALAGEPGDFMRAYKDSHGDATATVLEAQPFSVALYKFATSFDEAGPWVGSSKDLLDVLNERESDEALKRSREWPKTPRKLAEDLKRLAPALVEVGVYARRIEGSRREGRRLEVFYSAPTKDSGDGAKDTVTNTVTKEEPIDRLNKGHGDGGDDGDGNNSPQRDEDFGEV